MKITLVISLIAISWLSVANCQNQLNIVQVSPDLIDLGRQCCSEGNQVALGVKCQEKYRPRPEMGIDSDKFCFTEFWKCCSANKATSYCNRGKNIAQEGGICDTAERPNDLAGELVMDCCGACIGGRAVVGECPTSRPDSTFPEKTTEQCCRESRGTASTPAGRSQPAAGVVEMVAPLEDICNKCQYQCEAMANGTKHCICEKGYELEDNGHACKDIDECAKLKPCQEGEECSNFMGSFECIKKITFDDEMCADGFVFSEETNGCEEIAPIKVTTPSSPTGVSTTTSTQTSSTPLASSTVATETSSDSIARPTREDKMNDAKNFDELSQEAKCTMGFQYDKITKTCVDINECDRGEYFCFDNEYCVNINGSYSCETIDCPEGQKMVNGKCDKIACEKGWEYDLLWDSCKPIDFCAKKPCKDDETCKNVDGSAVCTKFKCPPGMKPNLWMEGCVDIDECSQDVNNTLCLINETCINTQGSFFCDCGRGFEKVNGDCLDVNECQRNPAICSLITSTCKNVHGSYECVCKPGFERDRVNPFQCYDINECSDKANCPENAMCLNSHGSYECKCPAGMMRSSNNTCELEQSLQFDCYGIKTIDENTKKVNCSCPHGFEMKIDGGGKYCKDIDECAYGVSCSGDDDQCVNTFGDHKCIKITCPESYTRDTKLSCILAQFVKECEESSKCDKPLDKPSLISYKWVHIMSNITKYASKDHPVEIYTISGMNPMPHTVYLFEKKILAINASKTVDRLTLDDLIMDNFDNQARQKMDGAPLKLAKALVGPQDIELVIDTIAKVTSGSQSIKSTITRTHLHIYVSEYDGQRFE